MTKKSLKIFSLALLLSFSLVLTGCGDNKDKDEDTKDKKQTTEDKDTKNPSTNNEETVKGSVAELLKKGKPLKCYVNSNISGSGSAATATFYIDSQNKKMYAESVVTTAGKSIGARIVVSDNFMYVWQEGQTTGIKMTATDDEINDVFSGNDLGNDSGDEGEYKCTSWTVDNSKFKTPSNITFTSLEDALQGIIPGSDN